MKKLFALLLSVALVLSACAFAEEAAPVTHSHKLSDVYLIAGDQVLDLSGLALELDVSGADEPNAARLHMNAADGSVAEAGIALVDNIYIIHLDSESLGHVDYAIDPVALLARYMDKGVNSLVEMLQSLNTSDMAQGLLGAVGLIETDSQAAEAPAATEAPAEEPEAPQGVVIDLSKISIEGNPMDVLMGCVSEPVTEQMGGVEYAPNGSEIIIADGSYTTREFNIDTETLCTILNMVCIDGEPSGLGDKVRDTGVRFEVHGSFQSGEDEGLNRISSITASIDDGNTQQTMALDINTFNGPDGETSAVTYGQTTDGQSFGLSFRLTKGQHEGEAFAAETIDLDGATPLTDLDVGEILATLRRDLTSVGMDAVSALTASLMGTPAE